MPPESPPQSPASSPAERAEGARLGEEAALTGSVLGSSVPPPPAAQGRTGAMLRMIGLSLGLGLFAYTLRDLDASHLLTLVRDLGALCLLILVPQALGMAFHTAAWKELLAALHARAGFFALTEIFAGSEAVRMALPAGPAVAESVAAYSLKARFGVPWTRALASLAAKKAWVLCTHALCLLLLIAVGQEAFRELAASINGGWALGWVALGMALLLTLTGAFTISLLASRRVGRAATRWLAKVPNARLKAWAAQQGQAPEAKAAADIPVKSHAIAAFYLLGQWATEVLETWLVLRLLGVNLSLSEALVVELGGSLVRSLAFVIPGGLGVQDASYVALLVGLGVPGAEAAAPAFVLLKRAKDTFFVVVGLGLFATDRRRRAASAHEASQRQLQNGGHAALVENQT